jgi:predicted phosphodiesterase
MRKRNDLITRRQAILSLGTITAGALISPPSILSVNSADSKTRFAVIGDYGTGESDQIAVAQRMFQYHNKTPLDFVLTVGDNIYPNGSGRHFSKHFEEPFRDILNNRVPFYATLGNHDVKDGRADQMQYSNFNMNGRRYYTIRKGNGLVEFFMIDSTDVDATQLTWLQNALMTSRARWKVALTHQSLYSSGKKHGSDLELRRALEPLYMRYGVNVAFSGHDHIYERTKPQNGIQYFVTGAGGKMRRGNVDKKSLIRAASFDRDNSFMLIELDEKGMTFDSISETGEVVDYGIIKQV